jgi:uncharacterized protein involved in response to NO
MSIDNLHPKTKWGPLHTPCWPNQDLPCITVAGLKYGCWFSCDLLALKDMLYARLSKYFSHQLTYFAKPMRSQSTQNYMVLWAFNTMCKVLMHANHESTCVQTQLNLRCQVLALLMIWCESTLISTRISGNTRDSQLQQVQRLWSSNAQLDPITLWLHFTGFMLIIINGTEDPRKPPKRSVSAQMRIVQMQKFCCCAILFGQWHRPQPDK